MTASGAQALDVCMEFLRRGEEVDVCLETYPRLQRELQPLVRIARRIWADADQVIMPRGFRERVWQKIVAHSGGSLPQRPPRDDGIAVPAVVGAVMKPGEARFDRGLA